MQTTKLAASLLVLLALVLGAAPVRAETRICTAITTLPAVITVQGVHCLTGDLSTSAISGNAIDIQTSNVVLDLNGFNLNGGAGLGTTAVGIYALNRQNITLKNGTIRGFLKGIFLENSGLSQGHIVQNVRADQNTLVGIQVEGTGNIVRNNQVAATGGMTPVAGNADATGILASGAGPRVYDNDVTDTTKQGTGTAVAIQFQTSTVGGLAEENRITGADKGIEFFGAATGKCRGNLNFGVPTPFTGCTDGNTPPVLTAGGTLNYTENQIATAIDTSVTVNDVDNTNLASATVQITGNCANPQDVLSFTNQSGISGVYTAATCLMTLTGSSLLANYQTALRSVKYNNTSENPSTLARTVTWIGTDTAGAPSVGVTSTINVTAVNDQPTANGFTNLPAQAGIPITYPAGKLGGTDPAEGTVVTINTTPNSLCAGCLLTLNADGSFAFTPPPSAAGSTVSFTYHVTDSGNPPPGVDSAAATVSFDVADPAIYFVKSAAVGAGNCTLGNECTLATAVTNIGATTNTRIFIGDANSHANAVPLNSGGWLIGQGVTGTTFDTLFGIAAPAQGTLATRPSINTTRPTVQNTVTLNTNAVVRGLNITTTGATALTDPAGATTGVTVSEVDVSATAATAVRFDNLSGTVTLGNTSSTGGVNNVSLSAVSGTVDLGGGALSGATTTAFNVTSSAPTVTYAGSITANASRAVSISNAAAAGCGTQTFSGSITGSGASASGILVNNCNAGTINFSGTTKTFSTQTNQAITLTTNAGATINFSGGNLSVTTTTAAAFTATGGGTINVTGTLNTLTSGTGTALNAASATLGMTFRSITANGGANGIVLNATSGSVSVTGDGSNLANGSGGSLSNIGTVALANHRAIHMLTVNGTASFSSMNIGISTLADGGVYIDNNATSTLAVNFTGCTFTGVTASVSQNKALLQYESGTAAVLTGNVQNCFFNGSRTYGFFASGAGTSQLNVTVNQSGFGTDVNTGAPVNQPGTTITNAPAIGMAVGNSSSADVAYTITNNTFWGASGSLGAVYAVTVSGATTTASSSLNGSFNNNKIGKTGTVSSGCSTNCAGLGLLPGTQGTFNATVNGNDIRQVNNRGIDLKNSVSAATSTAIAHITNNTVAEPDTTGAPLFQRAISYDIGNSSVGTAMSGCLEISGNNISGAWNAGNFIRVTTQNTTGTLTMGGFTDPAPPGVTAAEVESFIATNNPPLTVGDINVTIGGAINGGGPCP